MKRLILFLVAGLSSISVGLSLRLLHNQVSYPHCQIASRSVDLSYTELKNIAEAITVKVKTGTTGGSGTLIHREGKTYTVLTTAHVIATGESYQIETPDGKVYRATRIQDLAIDDRDIQLLQFQSDQKYQIAQLGSSHVLTVKEKVVAAGFADDIPGLNLTKGEIKLIPNQWLQQGYQIGYSNDIYKGMSGGPILNLQGEVISINGMMAYPLWGNPYVFEDGSRPDSGLQNRMREVAWGIPIHRIAEAVPQWVNLNLVDQVDAIAQQTTVLIANSNSTGSGVIVAQNDSTYYVLTAEHVIRHPSNYKIVTPDGHCHPIDLENVQPLPGVDLAIVEFESHTPYQVATLADYDWRSLEVLNYVFVSGWPVSTPHRSSHPPTRLLTTGRLLSQDSQIQSVLEVTQRQQGIDSLSLTYGYEMLYSNLTAPGMSGGLILDTQGHVIGIHGRGSGEIKQDDQGDIRPLKLGYGLGIPIKTFLHLVSSVGIDRAWLDVDSMPPPQLHGTELKQIQVSLLRNLDTPESSTDEIAWFNYGISLWQLEQYEEAMLAFNWAIQQDQSFYQAWYGLGMMLRFQKRYNEALAAFEEAIAESEGTFAPAWRARAEELVWLNRYDEALQSVERAITLVPNDIHLQELQGHLLQRLQRYSEAIRVYQEALKLWKQDRGVFLSFQITDHEGVERQLLWDRGSALNLPENMAIVYENRGDARGTVTAKLGVISHGDSQNSALTLNLALAYLNRGNHSAGEGHWQKAIADYSRALELEPENAFTYGNRGLARSRIGDQEGAIADLQQAAELFNTQADVTNFQRALEALKQLGS
ncbi:tetratricopeptide repeat-containing S1 family peptidase [Roseofilum capinflatum]|uniref:Tetratricopeptide repeat-containing serine protease family protein n=1 Tax=Roseofilum capinflatum BLCC-M114 TaxID=3022440 RepID=A0ABT7B2W7_9CYAN|nr:tetratricopeptide repeat-containing serine protease family protein [Roseofilum capinflatum]MDJ1173519.1 tetratricopeptide repeat-containing serine protease family protein [Roseofilum capinflatum BLCC-M114]